MARPKKQTRISIKIDTQLYKDFQVLCGENFQTVAGAVKGLMKRELENSKAQKILLRENELRIVRLESEHKASQ